MKRWSHTSIIKPKFDTFMYFMYDDTTSPLLCTPISHQWSMTSTSQFHLMVVVSSCCFFFSSSSILYLLYLLWYEVNDTDMCLCLCACACAYIHKTYCCQCWHWLCNYRCSAQFNFNHRGGRVCMYVYVNAIHMT